MKCRSKNTKGNLEDHQSTKVKGQLAFKKQVASGTNKIDSISLDTLDLSRILSALTCQITAISSDRLLTQLTNSQVFVSFKDSPFKMFLPTPP